MEMGALRWLCPAAALLCPAAYAADAADHLNTRETDRPGYLEAKPSGAFQLPPVPPAGKVPPSAGESAIVDHIGFRGNAVIPSSDLALVSAPYVGKRLNEAEIEELRQKLTRHYVDLGYVNSGALLGKDALVDGTLTFDIIEGHLKSVRLHGMERLKDAYVTGRLAKAGDLALNVGVLRERFQLLLDDPLFERLNARLLPDARLGEAILDVDVVRARPYQLTMLANNYRPPSIGADAYGLSGWVRNLTGYGDYLEASGQVSAPHSDSPRGIVGWHVPINQHGTQFSLEFDHGRSSVIEQPIQALDIKSILDSKEAGLSQTVVESLRHKVTFGLNGVVRENRTTLLGTPFSFTLGEPDGVTRIWASRVWQEYTFRSESQVIALRSTFTSAHNNIQESAGLPEQAMQSKRQYRLWLGQLQYARQVLDNGAQFIVRGTLQRTHDLLLPLDRMSIGGVYTVRGYRENQLIRDTGAIANVECEYPLVRIPSVGFNLILVPFYDYGRGKNLNEPADSISSIGLAARARWKEFRLDIAAAKRLVHPDSVTTSGGTLQDKGFHFQLSYTFFGG